MFSQPFLPLLLFTISPGILIASQEGGTMNSDLLKTYRISCYATFIIHLPEIWSLNSIGNNTCCTQKRNSLKRYSPINFAKSSHLNRLKAMQNWPKIVLKTGFICAINSFIAVAINCYFPITGLSMDFTAFTEVIRVGKKSIKIRASSLFFTARGSTVIMHKKNRKLPQISRVQETEKLFPLPTAATAVLISFRLKATIKDGQ